MTPVDQLPIYDPEFERGRWYRMSVLRIFDGYPGPRGGLAIVWNDDPKVTREILLGRRPAVMQLPDIWMSSLPSLWKQYAPQEYDQTWEFTSRDMAYSPDHEDIRAWGGYWLPVRDNVLMKMAHSTNADARAIAADTQSRCFQLCGEHDVIVPTWLKDLPSACARCGGTGNIGYISSVRCPDC